MESAWEDEIRFKYELKKPVSKMNFEYSKKPLIYISHPFLTHGNAQDNLNAVSKVLSDLVLRYKDQFILLAQFIILALLMVN